MAFNANLRDEKHKDEPHKAVEKKEKKLDDALKHSFPASDPVAKEQLVTGSRAKKPVLPKD